MIDSLTGDYTGSRVTDLHNAIYLRLKTPLGRYWADAGFGSRLHELARVKDSATTRRLAVQYTEQALQPMRSDGRITQLTVNVEHPQVGWLLLSIVVRQATGNSQTFTHPVRVI